MAGHSYFDHNASTSVAPSVLRAMPHLLAEVYGNASSIHHFGQTSKQQLESARRAIALRLGCNATEIVFTSGGTESDNLAIFGLFRSAAIRSGSSARRHVITSAIEHPAVLNTCRQLEQEGGSVTYLPVDGSGSVDPDAVRRALRPDTSLITIMHANNETGVVQPVREIARIAREADVPFHCDGVQAAGRTEVNLAELGVDLYSVSGHKFGAPKGIGALFVKKGVTLAPLLHGGHHERDRRAGTENVVGAATLALAMAEPCWNKLAPLRDRLEQGILSRIPACTVNGRDRLANTSNICFTGVEGEAMVISLDLRGYSVSSGSACSSGAVEPSHVLLAMGLSREDARSSVRFSLGPQNTQAEVDGLIEAVCGSVAHLRRLSPQVVAGQGEAQHV